MPDPADFAYQPPASDESSAPAPTAPAERTPIGFEIHRSAKALDPGIKGRASTIQRARRARDRHDMTYGAAVHSIKPVYE